MALLPIAVAASQENERQALPDEVLASLIERLDRIWRALGHTTIEELDEAAKTIEMIAARARKTTSATTTATATESVTVSVTGTESVGATASGTSASTQVIKVSDGSASASAADSAGAPSLSSELVNIIEAARLELDKMFTHLIEVARLE